MRRNGERAVSFTKKKAKREGVNLVFLVVLFEREPQERREAEKEAKFPSLAKLKPDLHLIIRPPHLTSPAHPAGSPTRRLSSLDAGLPTYR